MPSSTPGMQKTIVLRQRPTDKIDASFDSPTSNFAIVPQPIPTADDLKDGEVVLRVEYAGVEPSMRVWMSEARSYMPPVAIGEVMRSMVLGTVVATKSSKFEVGDQATALAGWAEYLVLPDTGAIKIRSYPGVKPVDFLGGLGITGQTAYWGLTDIGQAKAGETVVVSGAAGATGSMAVQIAVLLGCKVIAIAGSDEKCQWLEKDLGVSKALNYKDKDFEAQFIEHVGFLDVFYDNVGGSILNLALSRLNKSARIVMCGAIEEYNKVGGTATGLTNYTSLISQRGTMKGFIILDYIPRFREGEAVLSKWISEGKIKVETHIHNGGEGGIEGAPGGIIGLFEGKNTGKMVVQFWDATKESTEGVSKLAI
ncbi:hypothetical protein BDY24DRAFT_380284 [Mrakia frigida]|uniref:MDR family NADP-dependent oxidoreductase n=1 Tax=Mrakia frigida TaxID=29902 RepID=UPI003FCC1DFB